MPPSTASTTVSDVPACSLNQLALDYYGGGGATGNDFGRLRLRDIAAAPCILRGPVVVTGLDSTGHIVIHAISYQVAEGLVLTATAPRVPVGEVAPPNEHVADLDMSAGYRDDPATPDALCHTFVVPSAWELEIGAGTKRVRNAGYDPRDPTDQFPSLITCKGRMNTPDTVHLDD